MTGNFKSFLALPAHHRLDIFERTAIRLNTLPTYVEKDFWVCLVLKVLFNHGVKGHPNLLFKGGTSLSKAFRLVDRFSEDIDIVVFRDGLGFTGERNPTTASSLSNKKRAALFDELKTACSEYIHLDLRNALASRLNEFTSGCDIIPDEDDADQQTLLVEYPALFSNDQTSYVAPRIKIEGGGAKSALSPSVESCG